MKVNYVRALGVIATLFTLVFPISTIDQLPNGSALSVASVINQDQAKKRLDQSSQTNAGTYYSLRPDLRRCPWPRCGGFFVKQLNQKLTRCVDGKSMEECYVVGVEWRENKQVDGQGIGRGEIVSKSFRVPGQFGELRVFESWRSAVEIAPGCTFYRVKDRGVRCITYPCLTFEEVELNSTTRRNIAGVDLNNTGAPKSLIDQALRAMDGEGIIIAGSHVPVTGPAGSSVTLKAVNFYLPPDDGERPAAKKPCIKTGCSGQVCADENVITTCEWRPEYACYKKARCERQADGKCGFTKTPELLSCLGRN